MEISLDDFLPVANLVHVASKDEARFHMNGVCFEPKTGRGKATDGHRIAEHVIQGHIAQEMPEIIIDRNACEAMLRIRGYGYTVILSEEECVLKAPGVEQKWANIDRKFPDIDAVKPKGEPVMVIGLDAKLLVSLAKALKDPDAPKRPSIVTLKITNGISPIVVEANGNYGFLMPCRVDGATKSNLEEAANG